MLAQRKLTLLDLAACTPQRSWAGTCELVGVWSLVAGSGRMSWQARTSDPQNSTIQKITSLPRKPAKESLQSAALDQQSSTQSFVTGALSARSSSATQLMIRRFPMLWWWIGAALTYFVLVFISIVLTFEY